MNMRRPDMAATAVSVFVFTSTLTSAFADQSITAQIDAITARSVLAGNTWSMLVSDTSGNVTVYQNSPTLTQAPASNMKIMTSSGAFGLLGTTNAFITQVYRNGTFNGGVVTGDINLLVKHDITWNEDVFGTGNASAPLNFIATQLKNQGITQITGKVQVYGACMYDHAATDDTRDIQNQATYNGEGATAFKTALQAQGITVGGAAAGVSGFSPPGTLIYTYSSTNLTYSSKPLRLDVACIAMNKVSQNVMADLLLRHISYELTGNDDFTSGANKVFGWLKNTVGLSTNDMVMQDGSGLSHSDRMSAKEINTVIRYMLANFSTWSTTLPIGCVDGTLGDRFCGTDGSGRVHAKTGSLSITISLSGYVDNKYNGVRYFFSFLVNNAAGIDQTDTRQALDDAVNVFAGVIPTTIDSYTGNDGDRSMDIALPDAVNVTEVDAQNGPNGSLSGWSSIAGPTGSGEAPVVGYQADQRIRLFLRGSDNNVWTVIKALNGSWGSWSSLGGNIQGSVTVGYQTNGAIQIFARSSSNTVITCSQSGANGNFGSWSDLGGQCYDDPLITANTDSRFQLFTRSSTNTVQSNFKTTAGAWFGWSDYGGSCIGKPQGGQWTNGVIVVFTRTSSNTVHILTQTGPNGGWGSWSDLGGSCFSDPAVGYNADGRMQIFIQTSAHAVSSNFRNTLATNSTWSGWNSLGGTCYSNLSVGYNQDGRMQLVLRDNNYVMQSEWQTNINAGFSGWFSFAGNTPTVNITTQPASTTVNVGQNATFNVVAANALTYQWQFNGATISGATASSYTMVNAQISNAGTYSVVVANNAGAVTSANAVLTVNAPTPPTITTQPSNVTANQGQNATFAVTASGSAPLSYQWQKNTVNMSDGGNVSGSTTANLTLSSVTSTDAASYRCVVSNSAGNATSSAATLTVIIPPTITGQPQNANVLQPGGSATFTVSASGTTPFTYQWLFEGANIAGATLSSYTDSSVQTADIGNYACVVSNPAGSATSSDASLSIGKQFFSDNLDSNTSANWFIATNKSDSRATWAFDYSLRADKSGPGVPQNPFYTANTKALKLEANISSGFAINVITLSPKSISVSGDFQLRFDAWHNFTGPAPAGGTGSTEFISYGVCSPGNVLTWPTNSLNSGVFVAQDSDGDVAAVNAVTPDYGMYTNRNATTAALLVSTNTHCYTAVNGANPATWHGNSYYTNISGVPAPSIPSVETQSIMSGATNQTGSEVVGAFAFKWHEVILKKSGSGTGTTNITWYIDGFPITSVTNAFTPANGTNVSIGYFDAFGSIAATNFEFGLFSNLKVESFTGAGISPTITTQPANQTATAGSTVSFSVAATSPTTLRYQWQKDGAKLVNGGNVSGATTSTLTLTSVQTTDAAFYRCIVLNSSSYVISSAAGLTVGGTGPHIVTRLPAAAPAIVSPQVLPGANGNSVTFQFNSSAASTYQVQYTDDLNSQQWINLGNSIIAEGPSITINDVAPAQQQRFYRIVLISP